MGNCHQIPVGIQELGYFSKYRITIGIQITCVVLGGAVIGAVIAVVMAVHTLIEGVGAVTVALDIVQGAVTGITLGFTGAHPLSNGKAGCYCITTVKVIELNA